MIRGSKKNLWAILAELFFIFLALQSQVLADSPEFKVFIDEPLDNTYLSAYPEISDFFASDPKLVLVAEIKKAQIGICRVKVQVQNSQGEIVFQDQKEIRAKLQQGKHWIRYILTLDDAIKSKLASGTVLVKLHIDSEIYFSKQLKYTNQNYSRNNKVKVVFLPFFSSNNQLFDYRNREDILNTFSDALKLQIQRLYVEMVSSDQSLKRLGGVIPKACLQKTDCRDKIKFVFGEGIFISGNVIIPKADPSWGWWTVDRECQLEIFIYNSITEVTKKISSSVMQNAVDMNEVKAMQVLLHHIIFQEGLLDYIQAF